MYDMILPDLELDVTHIVENGKYFSKLALLLVLSSFLSFFHSFSSLLHSRFYCRHAMLLHISGEERCVTTLKTAV